MTYSQTKNVSSFDADHQPNGSESGHKAELSKFCHDVELHICQHCPCELDDKQCCINRTLLEETRIQGYQCKVLRYRHNRGMIED